MQKRGNLAVLVLLAIVVLVIAGCAGVLNPAGFFKADPEIRKFLDEYPDADFTLTHYSAEESTAEFTNIQKICGKELKAGKELYKAEIKDASTGLSVIAYFDMENQLMECVRKFGTEGKTRDTAVAQPTSSSSSNNPCKCPGETIGGHNYCQKKFGEYTDDGIVNVCECTGNGCSCLKCDEKKHENCPAEISISYDKDLYYVGDTFAVTFKVTDKQGNFMPYKKFSAMAYQDGKALADESFATDALGIYSAKKVLNDGDTGVYEYVAVVNEDGCPHVSTTNHFSVHFPTASDETTGCCELPPRACGSSLSKSQCVKYGGTFYDSVTHPSYTCVRVENTPPMSRCRPVTGVRNCASKIDLTFDKEQYRVGDSINIDVIALDKNYNRLPNKEFYVTATKDGKDLGVQTYKIDEKGVYNTGSTLEDDAVGEYVYRAYIKEDGCDYVVDSAVLTISRRQETPSAPTVTPELKGCCEIGGSGCGSPLSKSICDNQDGKFYDSAQFPSYTCVSVSKNPSASRCRPVTGIRNCPAKIYFAFNKDAYIVGDKIAVKVALMDSNNVAMKGKKFGITLSQNNGELQKAEKQTSEENGVYYEESEVIQSVIGEHEYTVYSQEEDCPQVTAKQQITVSAKLDSSPTTPATTPSSPTTTTPSTPTSTTPTSPTTTVNCAAKIYFAFNKQSYVSGDPITYKIYLYDSKDNVMKGKAFFLKATKNNQDLGTGEVFTDSETGAYFVEGTTDDTQVGEYLFEAYTNDVGCNALSSKQQITISAKQDTASNTPKLG
ncbi:TPA: hypothetical protein HA246_06890 [Candidatus Woesearchaeota archaeon]|nr:hypothetical protein [Candidatus Woesearchaeota archaeon]